MLRRSPLHPGTPNRPDQGLLPACGRRLVWLDRPLWQHGTFLNEKPLRRSVREVVACESALPPCSCQAWARFAASSRCAKPPIGRTLPAARAPPRASCPAGRPVQESVLRAFCARCARHWIRKRRNAVRCLCGFVPVPERCLTQMDRHHRKGHTPRVVAVAGLVNRQIEHRLGGYAC
jgi:hypothetical protein